MKMRAALAAVTILALASCAQGSFPMRNPQTGDEVMCRSGITWQNESWASDAWQNAAWDSNPGSQDDVLEACIHACERFGFRAEGMAPEPANPPKNMAVLLPEACRR